MRPGTALLLAILAIFSAFGDSLAQERKTDPTIILIVRHAEKDTNRYDPPLSPAGWERSHLLADMLVNASIRSIFVTQFRRTEQTVDSLARRIGVTPETVLVDPDNKPDYVKRLCRIIETRHEGETVLVSSHSDVIPSILKELGIGETVTIAESDYDNLFVVVRNKGGTARLMKLRYPATRSP